MNQLQRPEAIKPVIELLQSTFRCFRTFLCSMQVFKNLKFGESFAYEGTIAENIEQYKLDHLIIENTMNSIKAIDWALFTPHGIRSYYAKPFYERNVLRTILILCSKEPNAFSEKHIRDYDLLSEPFIQGLKNWRKACRRPKKQ